MREGIDTGTIPWAQRVQVLTNILTFAVVPREILEVLVMFLHEEEFPPGGIIVVEGKPGAQLYIIVEGRAQVSIQTPSGASVIATLGAGELFGELALLAPTHQRQATVTAITHLVALVLSAPALEDLVHLYPLVGEILSSAAKTRVAAMFLKQATLFAPLDEACIRRLAVEMKQTSFSPGATIVRQGQQGYSCYLIHSGRVEVLVSEDGAADRLVATLGPGELFGEAALLTDARRNATVRAVEPCDLLVLHRPDFLAALGADSRVKDHILALLHQRDRAY